MMVVMGRKATGRVDEYPWKDGSGNVSFYIRVPLPGGRRKSANIGEQADGWTREKAEAKLVKTMALLEAGMPFDDIFPPVELPPIGEEQGEPMLQRIADRYLQGMRDDAGLSDGDPDTRTIGDWRWALKHLLPIVGHMRPTQMKIDDVDALRRQLIKQRTALLKRAEAGHPVMEERSRGDGTTWKQRARPLSDSSINRIIDKLATLLDISMEDPKVGQFVNVARGKRRKLTVKTPTTRTYLEPEQVVVLLAAAKDHETRAEKLVGGRAAPAAAIVGCLVMGGQRISEVVDTERASVNVGARMMRAGGKTEAGMGREIDLVFDVLIDLLGNHLAQHPGGRLLFPAHRSDARRSPDNVRRMLDDIVVIAEKLALKQGIAPLNKVTPHALRRTNISLLSAAGYDPGWIMEQVGHTDPKLTLRIYNQVLKRKRSAEFRQRANELLGARPAHSLPVVPAPAPDAVPTEWSQT